MKRLTLLIALMLMLAQVSVFAQPVAVPQLMNFQGRLARPDGTPVPDGTYSIRFSLWTAASGGSEKWNQTINPVAVRNGVFGVALNTSTGAADKFNGSLFLEIKVGSDAPLSPRQPLASVAYAMKADSVKNNSITSASIADGTITATDLAAGTLNNLSWLLTGNANPSPNYFLGTTTNHPLNMRVNNRRAMQYNYVEDITDPDPAYQHRSINVLGGADINTIAPGVMGATIVGGGDDYFEGFDNPNTVTDNFGTIVGGALNTANGFSFIGGGYNNKATEYYSTIGGGTYNTASDNQTVIGGGIQNTASAFGASVLGGQLNKASGSFSHVGGGYQNTADGPSVTVSGGVNNGANHFYSTIGGGANNQAIHDFATVGGGFQNFAKDAAATVAGGYQNSANNNSSTVGGGANNTAGNFYATVGGGFLNVINGNSATIGGGYNNNSHADFGTIGGGHSNAANGYASTVPGGANNLAIGDFSFAAGRKAFVTHRGTFAWGDSTDEFLYSGGDNQFLVRAYGGIHFYGPLHAYNLPFGDRRNVQWDSGSGQFYYDNSSRKHKENITPLKEDFSKLLEAQPVTYTRPGAPNRWEIGFIAEDFDTLGLKRLVDYAEDGKTPEGINYEKMCVYLTAIARQQEQRLKTFETDAKQQEQRLKTLEAENAELKALKAEMAELKALVQQRAGQK